MYLYSKLIEYKGSDENEKWWESENLLALFKYTYLFLFIDAIRFFNDDYKNEKFYTYYKLIKFL